MTPTWKKGDVFYRFVGGAMKMTVERCTVYEMGDAVTVLENKEHRAEACRHETFLQKFAPTQEGAVDLEIARLKEDAVSLQTTVKRTFDLIAGYEMFKTVALRKTPMTHVKEEATQDELVASIKAIEEIK